MQIKVYNDGVLVHEGSAQQFLADNDYDPDVAEQLELLKAQPVVEFEMFSGSWKIKRVGRNCESIPIDECPHNCFCCETCETFDDCELCPTYGCEKHPVKEVAHAKTTSPASA